MTYLLPTVGTAAPFDMLAGAGRGGTQIRSTVGSEVGPTMLGNASPAFYERLETFESFATITDPTHYHPLPDDWVLGLADVVNSSDAIARGRYKAVNAVGAAVIAAAANAASSLRLPFAFSGDGACIAAPRGHFAAIRDALARTAGWAHDCLDLTLRIGSVPVAVVRAAGYDIRVARFAVTKDVSYAMFSGGGLAWAEARLKEGRFAITRADPGLTPDLSGLYCNFAPIRARQGLILNVIAAPAGAGARFGELVTDVLASLGAAGDAGRPRPDASASRAWGGAGFRLPICKWTQRFGRREPFADACARFAFGLGHRGDRMGLVRYGQALAWKTDFRKFDDALRLTVDCSAMVADAVNRRLELGRREGVCHFGVHRQSAANLTCVTPTRAGADHLHFVDGAAGGYAVAATKLKRDQIGAPPTLPGP